MNKSAIFLITFLLGIILISVLTALLVYFPVLKSTTDDAMKNDSGSYSREMMQKEYPGLGRDYVIFQGDDGQKTYAYLKGDGPMQDYDLFNNLNVYKTLVASPGTDLEYIQDVFTLLADIVSFTLYTRKHPEGYEVESLDDVVTKGFNATKKTKFITHGWMSSGTSATCMNIKEGFLNRSDVNVFIMDWSLIADVIVYPVPAAATRPISVYLAEFVNFLIEYADVDPIDIHFVGHSLGAHISGFAGRQIRAGKIGRITGLDPALPLFDSDPEERINHNDSHFVDNIIHTCAGFLGIEEPIGHADFYPNGGTAPQPGCGYFDITESCSHGKSWKLFAKSITIPDPLLACKDKKNEKKCGDGVPMGEPTPSHARGAFYLKTD